LVAHSLRLVGIRNKKEKKIKAPHLELISGIFHREPSPPPISFAAASHGLPPISSLIAGCGLSWVLPNVLVVADVLPCIYARLALSRPFSLAKHESNQEWD
jgi:hypothetical protein